MVTGASVVSLQAARINRLSRDIAPVLEGGHALEDTTVVTSVHEWRAAARRAAQEHGWTVRTGLSRDGSRVWAVRLDREVTVQERDGLVHRLNSLGALLTPR
jgi:hypothetical protein